jgi:hypothetical protein
MRYNTTSWRFTTNRLLMPRRSRFAEQSAGPLAASQQGHDLPDKFIRLAEDIGLITEIGEWVLHTACADAALAHCCQAFS